MGVIERLPSHLRTGQTARAITLPSAILLAGAGASAAILAGAPLAVAALAGAAAWAARVAFSLPRRARHEVIDPFAVGDPWRRYVQGAVQAQRRFEGAVRRTRSGPLRDRLAEVSERLAAGVRECWEIAIRGDALEAAVRELDVESTERELAALERERGAGRPELAAAAESLRNQLESAQRLRRVARDTADRLRRLEAQLDESAARAIELSVGGSGSGQLPSLGSEVDAVVGELESVRQALDEAGGGTAMRASG